MAQYKNKKFYGHHKKEKDGVNCGCSQSVVTEAYGYAAMVGESVKHRVQVSGLSNAEFRSIT